jgi:hypothetical protein
MHDRAIAARRGRFYLLAWRRDIGDSLRRRSKSQQQNRTDRSKSQHRFLRPKTVNSTP